DALQAREHAEVELVRVIDILREIGPRVALLTEQAAKWTEYETIRNDLRRRALRWYRSSFGATAAQRDELVARLAGIDREIERLADYVSETESLATGPADAARVAEEEMSRTRVALAEAQAARVETERAHVLREGDEVRLTDEDRALLGRDDELSQQAAALAVERSERERERARIAREVE